MAGSELVPAWHPEAARREIVFLNNLNFETYSIQKLSVDGGEPEEVYSTGTLISFPSFSSDGSKIAYMEESSEKGVLTVPSEGGGEPVQIENQDGWATVSAVKCSPAEPLIGYVEIRDGNYNLMTLSLDGGKPNNLTNYVNNAGNINRVYYLNWNHNGSELVFTRSRSPYSQSMRAVFTVPNAGGATEAWSEDPISSSEPVAFSHPSYAPDGNRLVCVHGGELWILQLR
jgi:Tol biopolymer transport system component